MNNMLKEKIMRSMRSNDEIAQSLFHDPANNAIEHAKSIGVDDDILDETRRKHNDRCKRLGILG